MKKIRKITNTLLYPRFFVVIPLIVLSTVLLIFTFSSGISASDPVAIISYLTSSYTLVVVCVGIVPFIRRAKSFLRTFKYTQRLVKDPVLRAKIGVFLGLAVNLVFAGYNLFIGLYEDSLWLTCLAGYYAAVAIIRFGITLGIRQSYKNKSDEHLRIVSEWKRYRFAGIASLFMTMMMSALIALVLFDDESFIHSGITIFIFAAYTFIKFASAIMGTVKFHKLDSPVLSASKALNLSMAVMSIFSLQTAMLSEFNDPNSMFTSPESRSMTIHEIGVLNTITGIMVWVVALTIAIYMIVHSSKKLNELREQIHTEQNKSKEENSNE